MLVWLDGRTNVKGKPQENFARELMELFTMGVGHVRRDRRLCRRARVHRLESRASIERVLHLQLRRWPARHHREGVHVPDLFRTAARRFRRVRPTRACRTAWI